MLDMLLPAKKRGAGREKHGYVCAECLVFATSMPKYRIKSLHTITGVLHNSTLKELK